MANRIRLRSSAVPLIQPGETIQAVFQAQTVSQYLGLAWLWLFILQHAYRVVLVTDRRILVCFAGRFRPALVRGMEREVPRATRIGTPHGFWWRCDSPGERLYVHRRFHEDVRKADDALRGAQRPGKAAVKNPRSPARSQPSIAGTMRGMTQRE